VFWRAGNKGEKIPEYGNPFDDLFFWLNLASINWGFLENEKERVHSIADKKGQKTAGTDEKRNQAKG
jgi:hypothetical protein